MNNFSGLWGRGAVSSYLAPIPGVIRAGEEGPHAWEPDLGGQL